MTNEPNPQRPSPLLLLLALLLLALGLGLGFWLNERHAPRPDHGAAIDQDTGAAWRGDRTQPWS